MAQSEILSDVVASLKGARRLTKGLETYIDIGQSNLSSSFIASSGISKNDSSIAESAVLDEIPT